VAAAAPAGQLAMDLGPGYPAWADAYDAETMALLNY
jgi:hypothetical protein